MKLDIVHTNPLYAKGEERVAHEVSRGESTARIYYRSAITHPVFASLDHPLFVARKEGKRISIMFVPLQTKTMTVNEA
ncbi:hypothetical protein ABIB50_000516 [Mucilaginibacter sp. UYCu711]